MAAPIMQVYDLGLTVTHKLTQSEHVTQSVRLADASESRASVGGHALLVRPCEQQVTLIGARKYSLYRPIQRIKLAGEGYGYALHAADYPGGCQ